MQGGGDGGLWADGELLLRVDGRPVRVGRPFALIGRLPGNDVRLGDPAVSARHAYLHLDRRGVFAVDLVSRTGTRFRDDGPASSAWLAPGDFLEVAGIPVELAEARVDGRPIGPGPCYDDPLGDSDDRHLARVALAPRSGADRPWVLGSELVFVGRSGACAVRLDGAAIARAHCAIVRSAAGAFVVDLVGRLTWVNRRPVTGAAALHDGDVLRVGSAEFRAEVDLPAAPRPSPARALVPAEPAATALAEVAPIALPSGLDLGGAPPEVLAWIVGLFQAGQGEMARRQNEFQEAMVDALDRIRADNAAFLREHLDQVRSVQRELAELRSQVAGVGRAPAPPPGEHQAPPRLEAPRPAPLRLPPVPEPPSDPTVSTAWLLQRIGQLEEQNRSSWRNLLSKLNRP